MELAQVNNTQLPLVQNNTVSTNSPIGKVEELSSSTNNRIKNDVVEATSHTNNFLVNISSSVNRISNLQTLQSETTTQLEMVKNFGQMVSSVATGSIDNYQGEVQDFIKTFNSKSQTSIERISKIIEEKESENSRTYFDGILGARPISQEELLQAVEEQKQRLEQVNETLNNEIIQTTQDVKENFSNEKEKLTQNNPVISSVNFEQESKQFTKETFTEFSSTMVDTQKNVEPVVGERLLAS